MSRRSKRLVGKAAARSTDKYDYKDFGVPEECKPQGEQKGKYNYTIKSPWNGVYSCTVEVQMATEAFYVKKAKPEFTSSPTIKWAKFESVADAWEHVKQEIGWGEGSV